MPIPIKMPQLGESVVKGTIIRWLKAAGDRVEAYQPLVEIETDKVVTKVPAAHSGVLLEIVSPAGATVEVGAVLAYLGQPDEVRATDSNEIGESTALANESDRRPKSPRRFTPVVLNLASEHNISQDELTAISGTGRGGRVSKKDVLRYLETRQQVSPPEGQPVPALKPAHPEGPKVQPGQTIELTPMRAAIAEHMLHSVQTSPHVTSVFEVDMSRVATYRQAHQEEYAQRGLKLTYTAFFAQAAVEALKIYPMANASLDEGKIIVHPHINIGLAVAVEGGLLVPVIKKAEALSLPELAQAIDILATRARSKQLTPAEVQGGTFTVTNPGMQGALFGTAIIHQPQAAILGVGTIVKRPVVVEGDAIAIRPMVYLSLTYDHRIMDGFGANRVLGEIKDFLETYE